MNKPTQKQLKDVWQWCGVKTKVTKIPIQGKKRTHMETICFPMDLNSLFQYAMPKLQKQWDLIELIWDVGAWDIHFEKYTLPAKHFYLGKQIGETFEDPALALFWAIYKVIEQHS